MWKTGGIVDSVDFKNGMITLFLRSFDGLQTIPISPEMPEWLLAPDTAFRAEAPCRESLKLTNFEKQEFGHLDEYELSKALADVLTMA